MKYMQKWGLKIVACLIFACASTASAQVFAYRLNMADSLFLKKQYTQSLELYQQIFNEKSYSPAMVLKMAYIEEGLGRTAMSLYYLNIYYQLSRDKKALDKMEELADRNSLTGYVISPFERFAIFLGAFRTPVMVALAVGCLLFLLLVMLKRKSDARYAFLTVLIFLTGGLIFFANLGLQKESAIVYRSPAFIMSGPSSGAEVVAVIKEGHRLTVLGKEDVWLKVGWGENDGYVKENQVLEVLTY